LASKPLPFLWHCYDLRTELAPGWQEDVRAVADSFGQERTLMPMSVTSREESSEIEVPVLTVGGQRVREEIPWLYELYRGRFRDLAQVLTDEPVSAAEDVRYGINLNVQRGRMMRYECHVDSNPIQGMLYFTDHPPGTGGELVVSNRGDVKGKDAVDADAARIYPVAGHLVLFDARRHTHYVRGTESDTDLRVAAAMNFYTSSAPETDRPADLNRHLFGTD
jgi:hypothetical protein